LVTALFLCKTFRFLVPPMRSEEGAFRVISSVATKERTRQMIFTIRTKKRTGIVISSVLSKKAALWMVFPVLA